MANSSFSVYVKIDDEKKGLMLINAEEILAVIDLKELEKKDNDPVTVNALMFLKGVSEPFEVITKYDFIVQLINNPTMNIPRKDK